VAEKLSSRRWATKLIIGAFLLMAVTGVLMFFELEHGLVVVVHQWSSWLLLIGAVGHLTANIRPLKNHLTSRWGARVSRVDPSIVTARLSALGIDATSEQSIREWAGERNQDENRLLGLVFLPEGPSRED
jgi:hypothetical protein